MKFGKTLYELRKQAGLSQKELANLLDVAQASINYWEKGQRIPSLEAAKNISTFFNISLDKLTDDMASDIMDNSSIDITKKEKSNFRQLPGNLNIDITRENYEKYKKYFNAAFSLIKEIMCNETNTKMFSVKTGKELKKKDIEEIFDSLSTDEKLDIFQEFVENFTINPIFDAINIDLRKDEPTQQ